MSKNSTANLKLIKRLKQTLQKELSSARFQHSLNVAELAKELSLRYALSPDEAYLAGLAHDLAREWPPSKLIEYLKQNKGRMKSWEKQNPVLLHGRVAAYYLQKELGFNQKSIIEAVKRHVIGSRRMGRLAQIVYVADFLEPGRRFYSEKVRQKILSLDLAEMFVKVTEKIISFLKKEKQAIAPSAYKMLKYYKQKLKEM